MCFLLLNVLFALFWTKFTSSTQIKPRNGYLKVSFGTSSPHTVVMGKKIELECCFNSSSQPSFKWFLKNKESKEIGIDVNSLEDGFSKLDYIRSSDSAYCTRISNSVSGKSHEGYYTCLAENEFRKANRTIQVMFTSEPSIYKPEVNAVNGEMKVNAQENVTLSCNVKYVDIGNFLYYYWSSINKSTHNWHKAQAYYKGEEGAPNRLQMNLTIVNVTEDDIGEYHCFVQTPAGKGRDTIHLSLAIPSYDEAFSDNQPKNKISTYVYAFLGVLVALILLSVLSFYERKKRNNSIKNTKDYSRGDFEFDVFVSCSRENGYYVEDYLLPLLEGSPYNLKVCYHHRDFVLGEDILDNMANAVYRSQKILIVVSDNYLDSKYCKYEMDAAMVRQLEEENPCLALIQLNNMNKKLPKKLKAKNFLDLTNYQEQKHIEKRLKSFLKDICKTHVGNESEPDTVNCFEMEDVVITV